MLCLSVCLSVCVCVSSGDVGRLKVVSKNSSVVLNDDIREVRQLCSDLEAVLRHQQKGEEGSGRVRWCG